MQKVKYGKWIEYLWCPIYREKGYFRTVLKGFVPWKYKVIIDEPIIRIIFPFEEEERIKKIFKVMYNLSREYRQFNLASALELVAFFTNAVKAENVDIRVRYRLGKLKMRKMLKVVAVVR